MSTKNDYTTEEWKAISDAPVFSGLFITLADAGCPVGIARDAMAAGKAIAEAALGAAPEIVSAAAATVRSGAGAPELPDLAARDRAKTQEALIGAIRSAVGAVGRKSPGEVEAYKTWLAVVAAKVTHASKQGGVPGISGTVVSIDEQEALTRLADVLGASLRDRSERKSTCDHSFRADPVGHGRG